MIDDPEAKTIATYDRTADWWTQAHSTKNSWEWAIKKFATHLPGGSILEVGCGGGRDAAGLIRHGYKYLGTDASAGMVRVAQQTVPNGEFRQLNAYHLTQLSQTFDGFWACAVLLHIPRSRIKEALDAIRAVVRPGGVGMISIKAGNHEEFEIRDVNGNHEERLFVYWTKQSFERKLKESGFRVIDYAYRPVSMRTNWHVFFLENDPQISPHNSTDT